MSYPEVEAPATPAKPSSFAKMGQLITGLFLLTIVLIIFAYGTFHYLVNRLPETFPINTSFVVAEGSSARAITTALAEAGFIDSEFILYLEFILHHDPSTIKASTYRFTEPLSARDLAKALTEGDFSQDLIRFTHTEGERATTIAVNAARLLPDFDSETFLTLATAEEGKLFPETYLIPRDYTAEELFGLLRTTFDEELAPLQEQIASHKLALEEIIIIASILEREANSADSMKMVSGILQNRLDIGMALQVDASIEYVLDKPLGELTPADLDQDTPYNTYLYPGLPPTAIGNPGLMAIEAVLNPTPSDYFFYITGTDGNFYYAQDYDEHLRNIARYLR